MLNFCSLYSGSSGNSFVVGTERTNILIDAGVSSRKLEKALDSLLIDPLSINGILITHEHTDHTQGVGIFSNKYNIPVYVNKKTLEAMPKQKQKISENNIHLFEVGDTFYINELKINSFSVPHDAANPCGFNIFKDDKKISIATDVGHMTNDILNKLEQSNFIMLESNYDPDVLKYAPYPYHLKNRIAGPTGHLSNEIAGKTISHLMKSGLKGAMLGHLSKESNFPELAYKTVVDEIISSNADVDSLFIEIANRDCPSKLINL